MEEDLGGPVERVAVAHRNTEHPQVHIARGVSLLMAAPFDSAAIT